MAYEATGSTGKAVEVPDSALAHSPIEDSSERDEYERLLVRLYEERGQPEAAENVYRNVLSARRKHYGDFHDDVASALFGLAAVLVDHGNQSEAEDALRECLSIREAALESPEELTCPTTTVCRTMEALTALSELLETPSRSSEADEFRSRAVALLDRGRSCSADTVRRIEELNRRMATEVENP